MSIAGRFLIIEDEPDFRNLVALVADKLDFAVGHVAQPERWRDTYRAFRPDVIVLDLMMPGVDGVQILAGLSEERCTADIILISGADPRIISSTARVARERGLAVREVLHKPVTLETLVESLYRYRRHLRAAADDSACARTDDGRFAQTDRRPAPSTAMSDEEVRAALAGHMFGAHYQPKISLQSDREWVVDGVEALARWNHPRHGTLLPAVFIPVTERLGLIGDLTIQLAREACQHVAQLRRDGFKIDLSINLSPSLLTDASLLQQLDDCVTDSGLGGDHLILEITEGTRLEETGPVVETATRLRLKGIRLSMDDFGIGYSSLARLCSMPFSELKIDRLFVRQLENNQDVNTVVRLTVELAHQLGLNVCAEGVETRSTLEMLRAAGCDQAQGYLISAALSAAELQEFLARNVYEMRRAIVGSRVSAEYKRPMRRTGVLIPGSVRKVGS